jgi:hypothetical protein
MTEAKPMFEGRAQRRVAASVAAIGALLLLAAHAEARSWSYTGRGGRTWSRTVTPYNNGGGNFGRTVTTTRPAGTTTRQFSQTNNGNGTFTDTRTATAPNGQTFTNSYTRN